MAKYASFGFWTSPLQMLTINLETMETHLTSIQGGRGVIGKASVWLPASEKLITANGEGGYISEYDPVTHMARTIAQFPDRDAYVAALSNDGRIFWGTYPGSRVVEYNPATDAVIDHGPCDSEFLDAHYGYTIGVDPANTHVYIGPGQSPWYLSVLELATGEYTVYFKGDDLGGMVYTSVDGTETWYYRRRADSVVEWYTLIGGVVTLSTDSRPPFRYWDAPAGVDAGVTSWPARYGIEFDLSQAQPTTATPTAILRWREGEGAWNELSISGIKGLPQVLKRVYAFDANRLLCISGLYGPLFLYNPTTEALELLGWTNRSLYDALKIGTKWYLSGYTAVTMEWDDTQPWTLVESTPDRALSNPRDVLQVHKYHYYSAEGPDGWFYTAVNHIRDSFGGDLGWFDPTTEVKDHLRAGFELWSPRGLATVGDVLVYSGNSLEGLDGQLIVFDPDTKSIVDTITPLAGEGITEAGCIIPIGGDVIGIVGTRAYRVTVATKASVWKVNLPAAAFHTQMWYDRRVEIAPDGLIYLYMGAAIYTLNPATGAAVKVRNDSGNPGGILWHNGIGYIEGGTTLRTV